MARRLSTVSDLVNEVREQLSEFNVDAVNTEDRILPTLNRGQDYAWDLLARRYPDRIIKNAAITPSPTVREQDLPEDCFEDRINRVEVSINGTFQEVRRISYYDAWRYESPTSVSIPGYYSIIGQKIRLYPASNGTYPLRIWYITEPNQLVLDQGRITAINQASSYVIVDAAGSDLSTESDTLESYVNIVDTQTGYVKLTAQIQVLDGNKITLRTTPTRTSVLNRTLTDPLAFPASPSPTIELDDFVCSARGTCIPPQSPLRNFMVEFTVAEIMRSLGYDVATEEQILGKFEKQIENTAGARETTMRVQRRSGAWGRGTRRWFVNQPK